MGNGIERDRKEAGPSPSGLQPGRSRPVRFALAAGAGGLVVLLALLLGGRAPLPQQRHITIVARQYAYDPPVLHFHRGDTVHIKLVSEDVVHGFFLEGYDIDAEVYPGKTRFSMRHPSQGKDWKWVEEIVFVAEKTGKFRYRCSHTCGYLHPFMLGEMFVEPNRLLPVSLGLVGASLLAGLVLVWPIRPPRKPGARGAQAGGGAAVAS